MWPLNVRKEDRGTAWLIYCSLVGICLAYIYVATSAMYGQLGNTSSSVTVQMLDAEDRRCARLQRSPLALRLWSWRVLFKKGARFYVLNLVLCGMPAALVAPTVVVDTPTSAPNRLPHLLVYTPNRISTTSFLKATVTCAHHCPSTAPLDSGASSHLKCFSPSYYTPPTHLGRHASHLQCYIYQYPSTGSSGSTGYYFGSRDDTIPCSIETFYRNDIDNTNKVMWEYLGGPKAPYLMVKMGDIPIASLSEMEATMFHVKVQLWYREGNPASSWNALAVSTCDKALYESHSASGHPECFKPGILLPTGKTWTSPDTHYNFLKFRTQKQITHDQESLLTHTVERRESINPPPPELMANEVNYPANLNDVVSLLPNTVNSDTLDQLYTNWREDPVAPWDLQGQLYTGHLANTPANTAKINNLGKLNLLRWLERTAINDTTWPDVTGDNIGQISHPCRGSQPHYNNGDTSNGLGLAYYCCMKNDPLPLGSSSSGCDMLGNHPAIKVLFLDVTPDLWGTVVVEHKNTLANQLPILAGNVFAAVGFVGIVFAAFFTENKNFRLIWKTRKKNRKQVTKGDKPPPPPL